MEKDFKQMIINAGVKITLIDFKIEEVAVNEGASVTLENMQVNKLELLGNNTRVTNVYLDKGSKVKNIILETKTNLFAVADSQIEEIAIKTEAKDSVLEIKNAKGMNIKADNDFKLNGKDVDKNNVSQHLKDIIKQQTKIESDKTTSTGNNSGGNTGGSTGGDNNPGDDGSSGGGDDTGNTTPDEKGTVQTVYAKLTDKFILGEKNSSLDNVQHNLNLPWDLDGCDIYWAFSIQNVIDYDGTVLGIGKVELTATIRQGDERLEKKFNLTVKEFIDLEDMRQALDNAVFVEEISADYELPEYIGGYRVIYITNSTCVGKLDRETYTLRPIENGIAQLLVMMSASGDEGISRTIEIRVNLNETTPLNTTTDAAISLAL